MTEKLGILGKKLSHSLSPLLHEIIGKHLNIDLDYGLIESDYPVGRIRELNDKGYKGLNITIPYKEQCLQAVQIIDEAVRYIGAANTIKFSQKGIEAFNTDWIGFIKSLHFRGFDCKGKKAVLFGAGGAARAIVFALEKAEIESIQIINRSSNRALNIVSQFELINNTVELKAFSPDSENLPELISKADIVINATSLGMYPHIEEEPFNLGELVSSSTLVYDVVYNPFETKFLRCGAQSGAESVNGIDMLIHQALEAAKIWFEFDTIEGKIIKAVKSEFMRIFK